MKGGATEPACRERSLRARLWAETERLEGVRPAQAATLGGHGALQTGFFLADLRRKVMKSRFFHGGARPCITLLPLRTARLFAMWRGFSQASRLGIIWLVVKGSGLSQLSRSCGRFWAAPHPGRRSRLGHRHLRRLGNGVWTQRRTRPHLLRRHRAGRGPTLPCRLKPDRPPSPLRHRSRQANLRTPRELPRMRPCQRPPGRSRRPRPEPGAARRRPPLKVTRRRSQ